MQEEKQETQGEEKQDTPEEEPAKKVDEPEGKLPEADTEVPGETDPALLVAAKALREDDAHTWEHIYELTKEVVALREELDALKGQVKTVSQTADRVQRKMKYAGM
jgi:hypothetical protein